MASREWNGLFATVQSTCRTNHSTETALLKFLNDILVGVDGLLALLDQTSVFDTTGHDLLLYYISVSYGLSRCVLSFLFVSP